MLFNILLDNPLSFGPAGKWLDVFLDVFPMVRGHPQQRLVFVPRPTVRLVYPRATCVPYGVVHMAWLAVDGLSISACS